MSAVGQPERKTQDRVVRLLNEQLGYQYLGNWKGRAGTSNIEVALLAQNLRAHGYDDNLINKAIDALKKAAAIGAGRGLYEANHDVYGMLRYGVKVKPGAGEQYETVQLIDWDDPQANHFAVVQEVTVLGQHTKRPDVVLYVNGIALVTLELKRSYVAVSEGIRQTIGNQSSSARSSRPCSWCWPATMSRAYATRSSTRPRSTGWRGKSPPPSRTRWIGR